MSTLGWLVTVWGVALLIFILFFCVVYYQRMKESRRDQES